jgi:uncharacterized membrane protein YgdD (TMEM256/DUF423 family)
LKPSTILKTAAIFGALAVGIGAFGAHGLRPLLEASGRMETFETAVKYHFYHSIALLALGIWTSVKPDLSRTAVSFWGFTVGILIFSGSLYLLSLLGITWLGAITPIGGVAFIIGWLGLFAPAGQLTD